METHITDLTEIAPVVSLAAILGLTLMRLRQPAIVGFILAGVVLGPTGAGLIAQSDSIRLLAELGVLMLLFLIGMELSLKAFRLVLWPAVLTAAMQIAAALAITFSFGYFLGWSIEASVLLGFVVALSSTAVVVKMLEEIDELRSEIGQITIGVMIAQDIAVVPMLVFASSLGGDNELGYDVFTKIALAFAGLVALIWWLGGRGKLPFPWGEAMAGRTDITALAALGICFTAAAASGVLGLSPVYGAFVAGLVVGSSTLRTEMVRATVPIQSVLVVVFFLSIGLLIDLQYVLANIGTVLAFAFGVIAVKTVLNVVFLRLVGQPWERAFPAGLITSQIGEFSFILAAIGLTAAVIDADAYRLAISVIAMSLILSPIWMTGVRRFHDAARGGIGDIRETLWQAYEEELHRLGTAAAAARRAAVVCGRGARPALTGTWRSAARAGAGMAALLGRWRRSPRQDEPPRALPPADGDERLLGQRDGEARRE